MDLVGNRDLRSALAEHTVYAIPFIEGNTHRVQVACTDLQTDSPGYSLLVMGIFISSFSYIYICFRE